MRKNEQAGLWERKGEEVTGGRQWALPGHLCLVPRLFVLFASCLPWPLLPAMPASNKNIWLIPSSHLISLLLSLPFPLSISLISCDGILRTVSELFRWYLLPFSKHFPHYVVDKYFGGHQCLVSDSGEHILEHFAWTMNLFQTFSLGWTVLVSPTSNAVCLVLNKGQLLCYYFLPGKPVFQTFSQQHWCVCLLALFPKHSNIMGIPTSKHLIFILLCCVPVVSLTISILLHTFWFCCMPLAAFFSAMCVASFLSSFVYISHLKLCVVSQTF